MRRGRIEIANGCHERDVGVARIHGDFTNVMRVVETAVRPRFAGIGGFVHAVAVAHGVTQRAFAGAHVDGIWMRGRDRDRANRRDGLAVEHRRPHAAGVDGFPDATIGSAKIKFIGTAGDAARRGHTPAAEGAEHAPLDAARKTCEIGRRHWCRVYRWPRAEWHGEGRGGLCVQRARKAWSDERQRGTHRARDGEKAAARDGRVGRRGVGARRFAVDARGLRLLVLHNVLLG